MTLRWAARIVLAVSVVVITDLALQPGPDLPGSLLGSDKVEHAVAFLALAVLCRLSWPRLSAWLVAPLLLTYGFGIEVAQASLTTGRTASLADLAADAAGLLAGLILVRLFRHRPGHHNSHPQ
jgi:VanZ family protein